MILTCALTAALATQTASPPDRPTLLLAISIGGSGEASVAISELLTIAANALESRANLRLLAPDQAGLDPDLVERCGARPRCWIDGLSALGDARPKYLVVVGVATRANAPSLLTAVAFEAAAAKDLDDEHLLSSAISLGGYREVAGARDADALFAAIFGEALRPLFEKNGDWRTAPAPLARSPQPRASPEPHAGAPTARFELQTPLFYSGLALTAASAAVFAYAIASTNDTPHHVLCIEDAACVSDTRFERAGALRLAPAAYALAAAGATWIISSRVFDEDLELWLAAAFGLALGAGAYGLSVALD